MGFLFAGFNGSRLKPLPQEPLPQEPLPQIPEIKLWERL